VEGQRTRKWTPTYVNDVFGGFNKQCRMMDGDDEEGHGSAPDTCSSTILEEEHDRLNRDEDGDADGDVYGYGMGVRDEPAYDDPEYDKNEHQEPAGGVVNIVMSDKYDNSEVL